MLVDEHVLSIGGGKATVSMPLDAWNAQQGIGRRLTEAFEFVLAARQLAVHQVYRLSGPARSDVHRDGSRVVFLEVRDTLTIAFTVQGDIRAIALDGEVIRDTRLERLERQRLLSSDLAALLPGDSRLGRLMRSYRRAVEDPEDELVHLYEIRETVAGAFDSERSAKQALGISSADWSRLGVLANDEPVMQGRHRGRHDGELRSATSEELREARGIAVEMIHKYVEYRKAQEKSG